MPIVIRTAFNNQNWKGRCKNADRDRRLFQCHKAVINVQYAIDKGGQCAAECWEQSLCAEFAWHSPKGSFGERAVGRAYFVYRDVDQSLVLWGRSVIQAAEDESLEFKKFHALPENMQVRDLTYEDLEAFGVPAWRSGTFRYISDATAGELDALISESGETLSDLSEESWALEGRALLKRHVTKERSAKLIKAFKAQLTDFACSVCGFSFEQIYGAVGAGFIEAHHVVPIATLTANTKMSISDLVPVCSNCHRMLHRDNPPLSLKALKEVMAEQ